MIEAASSEIARASAAEIRRLGLSLICEALDHGQPIDTDGVTRLSQAPFPALIRLVEFAQTSQGLQVRPTVSLKPVMLLEIAERLNHQDEQSCVHWASNRITKIFGELTLRQPLSIAVDRWTDLERLENVLTVLGAIVRDETLRSRIHILGPSSSELLAMQRARSEKAFDRDAIIQLLDELRAHGISTLDGGAQLEVHEIAAREGFSIVYGHDISSLIEASSSQAVVTPLDTSQLGSPLEERIALELLDLRERFGNNDSLKVWFPWFRSALTPFSSVKDEALGIPTLRFIAIARLILPPKTTIRAPISLLGRHLAELATSCGANDLGYAAIDRNTSDALGVSLLSDVQHLSSSDSVFERWR